MEDESKSITFAAISTMMNVLGDRVLHDNRIIPWRLDFGVPELHDDYFVFKITKMYEDDPEFLMSFNLPVSMVLEHHKKELEEMVTKDFLDEWKLRFLRFDFEERRYIFELKDWWAVDKFTPNVLRDLTEWIRKTLRDKIKDHENGYLLQLVKGIQIQ